jgi:allantoinase
MSAEFDVVISGGTVVSHTGTARLDLGISRGKITALESSITAHSSERIDARGLHLFPGLIDSHVHFNEPGRETWEGFQTGSRALAAGGGTLFFDMPLNASPPTLDAKSFDLKLAAAKASSVLDFGLWGGLVPGNADQMEDLAKRGVVGFKAFMSNSGIEDFPRADESTLREGMKRAADLGRLVAVHAEDEELTSRLARVAVEQGQTSVRDYLSSRPIEAELEAISRAVEMASAAGCALHVVHVSSGAGVALITRARQQGVNVTCETCPHYLALTEEDMVELGAVAKCAPPLRPTPIRDDLWNFILNGKITTVGSDHSPSPPSMKTDPNFFKVWGGISGIQHTLPILITEGQVNRSAALSLLSKVTSFNVAKRFGLAPEKGRIATGADADLALINLGHAFEPTADSLFYRHRQSPYLGRKLFGGIVRTMVGGETVFQDGKITSTRSGRLIRPIQNPAKA